ncbi:MAG: putative drug exporter of the superfamily [Solirubrobacteraceae bacterium]|jgi:RND superfamily putative drug exporter|nr:putative drug exporter of the superfamily [Solirubrobacteraceae bacterium]
MQRLMLNLDGVLRRRQWLVLGAWVAVLLAAAPLAARQSEHLSGGGFSVPGSDSQHVVNAVDHDFTGVPRTQLAAVLVPERGASAGDLRAGVARVARAADRTPHVALTPAARHAAERRAAPGRTLVVPLAVTVSEDASSDVAVDLRRRLGVGHAAKGGVDMHLVGQGALWAGLQEISKADLASAESIGFPIVLLILLVVFGSFAAATLPLALGAVSVVLTGAEIFLLSRSMEMSVFVTNMASMIGIGVAVDYSLFILARYREEVRAGHTPDEARAIAMSTSGVAVAFSGATVIVSLAGLWMVDNTALRSMALGAMLVVAVSVLASATLLPVLMRVLGRRAYARNRWFTVSGLLVRSWRRRRRGSTRPGAPAMQSFWTRWTALVTRRPVAAVVVSSAILLALAAPALGLKTGTGALHQFPQGYETRVGFEKAAAVTGPGASGTLQVLSPANPATVREVRRRLAGDPAVARLGRTFDSRDGRHVLVTAVPRQDAESGPTKALVGRLRAELPRGVYVGGPTARQRDVHDLIAGSMWKIVLFVLGLSYVVLLVLLRSVLLPLKAVLMNLLSVGAAYGVLVSVFGQLDVLTPPLVLAVVFGLSMDYEVFLLSRIRERWEVTGDSRRAVAEGLASSARTITSAALIMASVFLVFVGTGVPSIKELGLGNAVAIVVDATLVRLVLVPATMELLGDWNWWLPRPLDRLLPRSSFEHAATTTAGAPEGAPAA